MEPATTTAAVKEQRIPAWAVLLEWLVERGQSGVSVLEILQQRRRGMLLGASYRQRLACDIRPRLGAFESVISEERIVAGQTQTVYTLSFFYYDEARRLAREAIVAAGGNPTV